jgi:penicillin amidase
MIFDRALGAVIAAILVGRGRMLARPPRSLTQRLAALPATAPTEAALRIHWNRHQIPWIEAASEADLAVGLGIVHAHLRLGQMEMLRRVAQGRVAEMVGPLGIELDRSLRLMRFDRAVPAIVAALTPEVRVWAEGFVRGVNHVLASCALPEEMRLLGIGREPWTLVDLFTSARLAAADVSWLVYARLLRARTELDPATWRALWPKLLAGGMPEPDAALAGLLSRAGSNAAAVSGARSKSGGALFAADPHLSVALPNIWLAAGLCCPTVNAVGLMPAGFPIIAIGRNRRIAWGGTSLHAAASDLFDVSALPLTERTETLRVRGVGRRTITLRDSPLGPVVSDGMLFRQKTPLALRWVGHAPSDEMGAMLGVMRADGSAAFARALEGFAIPGQNMLHATAGGSVGHMLALRSPRRRAPPADVVLPPEAAGDWDHMVPSSGFPSVLDPPSGVVASANDPPPPGGVPPGFFYSMPTRAKRLHALLDGHEKLDLADLVRTQTDVQAPLDTVRALLARARPHPAGVALTAWDGRYDTGSAGALLFEATLAALQAALPDQAQVRPVAAIWRGRAMLTSQILALDDATLQPMLGRAMDAAMALQRQYRTWGNVHRMRLRHYLAAVPGLGGKYDFGEYGSPGGNDTLDKTGNPPVTGRHGVTYGASARFLADMADPDANRVVLLGGQDGWLGSETFLDQVPLWRAGRYVDLPLRVETARGWPHVTVLRPA